VNFGSSHARGNRTRAVVRIAGLVDLVFLLLAFFLVTTALLDPESSIAASLGAGVSSTVVVPPAQIEVGAGRWTLGSQTVQTSRELQELLEALPRGPGVVVQASPGARASDLVQAIQAARSAGMTAVRLQTTP